MNQSPIELAARLRDSIHGNCFMGEEWERKAIDDLAAALESPERVGMEADEALMHDMLSTLISVEVIYRDNGDKSAIWEDVDASITALRKRLESSK